MTCKILFYQDSESTKVNIMWLIPQYLIIAISEVLKELPNSGTENEFVYTQVSHQHYPINFTVVNKNLFNSVRLPEWKLNVEVTFNIMFCLLPNFSYIYV